MRVFSVSHSFLFLPRFFNTHLLFFLLFSVFLFSLFPSSLIALFRLVLKWYVEVESIWEISVSSATIKVV